MTHYNDNPNMVRVDFFKSSGKWYTTEMVEWLHWSRETLIHNAFKMALRKHFENDPDRLSDMDAICLEPYHELEHPLCIRNGGWVK